MNQEKKEQLLTVLKVCRICSTNQIGRLFLNYKQPNKRAHEHLMELQKMKLVTSHDRGMKPMIWRLTKAGREMVNDRKEKAPSLKTNVEHTLGLGEVFFSLWRRLDENYTCPPPYFVPELRESYGEGKRFDPDAFLVYRDMPCLLELQLTELTRKRWAVKWQKWNEYIGKGYYKDAAWQILKDKGVILKPKVLVVSEQNPDVVKTGAEFDVFVFPNFYSIF